MNLRSMAPSSRVNRRRRPNWRDRAIAALAVLIATVGVVHGEVRVTGDAGAVQLDATRSNVGEVLSALQSAFALRVSTSMALDRDVSGTYTGALAQILPRILRDYNYVIRRNASEIDVTVVGSQGARAVPLQRPRLPPGNTQAMSLADYVRLKNK